MVGDAEAFARPCAQASCIRIARLRNQTRRGKSGVLQIGRGTMGHLVIKQDKFIFHEILLCV